LRRLVRLPERESLETQTRDTSSIDGETVLQVRRAIQALPAKYREVIVLRYLEEMEPPRIAEVLGVSNSALNVRLHRARAQLEHRLRDLREDRS